MEVFISVVGQKMRIATNCRTFVDGSMNFIKFKFILSDAWSSLEKKAQFVQDGVAYNRELDGNNSVYLPSEIHDGSFELILHGAAGLTSAVTDSLTLTIKKSNYRDDGKDSDYVFATVEEMKRYLNI